MYKNNKSKILKKLNIINILKDIRTLNKEVHDLSHESECDNIDQDILKKKELKLKLHKIGKIDNKENIIKNEK